MEKEYKEESVAIEGIAGTLARDQFPRTVDSLHDPHDTHTQRSSPQSMYNLALVLSLSPTPVMHTNRFFPVKVECEI